MYDRDQLFIDGKWGAPDSDAVISVISPHTEAVVGHAACAASKRNRIADADSVAIHGLSATFIAAYSCLFSCLFAFIRF
jgi:hypothetical protein